MATSSIGLCAFLAPRPHRSHRRTLYSRNIVQAHMQRCANTTEQRINFLLEEEKEPFTLNEWYLRDFRAEFLGYYRGIRQKAEGNFVDRLQSKDRETKVVINRVISSLAELDLHSVEPSSLTRLLPPDPMETAIEIMSEVQAYFQGSEHLFFRYFQYA
jgi:hypothetical protein